MAASVDEVQRVSVRRKYHPIQIALHWLIVALIILQYATSGAIVRTHQAVASGHKPAASDHLLHLIHNRSGLIITGLMFIRLVLGIWFAYRRHPTGPLQKTPHIASVGHALLYILIISQGITGVIASYLWWPISAAHVVLFKIILLVVAGHVGMAFWHQFVRKDVTMHCMLPGLIRCRNGPCSERAVDVAVPR